MSKAVCACGCGGRINVGRTWLKGHCNRGRKRPDASARMKAGGAAKASCAHWGPIRRPPYWGAFEQHKWRANRQDIEFLLTYQEWISIWQDSGKLEQRGTRFGLDGYCMARFGDEGPYAVGNVKIITNRENLAERDHTKIARGMLGNKNGCGNTGLLWINNGHTRRRVRPGTVVPIGWSYGIKLRKPKNES